MLESLVIIGMGGDEGAYPGKLAALADVRVPLLDLYGSKDLPHVLGSAEQRARSAQKRSDRNYTQMRAEGANHFFQGHERELLQPVLQWLDGLAGT